jgi:hypothetical protein
MRKAITLLMGIAAVAAFSAVLVSNAAAALCTSEAGATTFRVCLFLSATELELLEAATFSVLQEEEGSGGAPPKPLLKIEFASAEELTCLTATGTGGVEVELGTGALNFTECTVITPEDCAIENSATKEVGAVSTEKIDGVLSLLSSGSLDVLFAPLPPATVFATFSIFGSGGTCVDAVEKAKITGEQLCVFLEPIETDEVQHLFECTPEGSTLNFAGNVATLLAEWSVLMSTPTSDASWSIVQGL